MLIKRLRFMAVVVLISGLVLALSCSDAAAQPRGGGGHGWLGFDIAVSALGIGALIDSLPPRYTTVVVAGNPYYYYDNYYYRPYPYGGYILVIPGQFGELR